MEEGRRPEEGGEETGGIGRFDERDNLFARRDLFRWFGRESDAFRDHYRRRPEHRAFDESLDAAPPLGHSGGGDAPMFDAQFDAIRAIAGESFVDGEPAEERILFPPERAAEKVKAFALHLGAAKAGAGPLRGEWVHSHVGRSFGDREGFAPRGEPVDLSHHPHAVAFLVPMEERRLRSAPEFPVLLATARAYADAAWIAVQLAGYIRSLGWSARAHHLYNYRALVVPVAADCGLGEVSRAGLLLNREMGLGCRIGLVTTALPLAHDPPARDGIAAFCERCRICAEECPSGAIPRGDRVEWNGVRKWKLREERCYRFWRKVGTDCGLCLAVCPWTKPDNALHRAAARIASIPGPHQGWMARADRILYGKRPAEPGPSFLEAGGEGREEKGARGGPALPSLLAVAALLLLAGLWGAREWGAHRGASPGAAGAVLLAAWLLWVGAGAWTAAVLLAEGAKRAAAIAALFFGVPAAAALLLLRAAGFP